MRTFAFQAARRMTPRAAVAARSTVLQQQVRTLAIGAGELVSETVSTRKNPDLGTKQQYIAGEQLCATSSCWRFFFFLTLPERKKKLPYPNDPDNDEY